MAAWSTPSFSAASSASCRACPVPSSRLASTVRSFCPAISSWAPGLAARGHGVACPDCQGGPCRQAARGQCGASRCAAGSRSGRRTVLACRCLARSRSKSEHASRPWRCPCCARATVWCCALMPPGLLMRILPRISHPCGNVLRNCRKPCVALGRRCAWKRHQDCGKVDPARHGRTAARPGLPSTTRRHAAQQGPGSALDRMIWVRRSLMSPVGTSWPITSWGIFSSGTLDARVPLLGGGDIVIETTDGGHADRRQSGYGRCRPGQGGRCDPSRQSDGGADRRPRAALAQSGRRDSSSISSPWLERRRAIG